MEENYVVYLHYGENESDPFYVGAANNIERPYNIFVRSKEWLEIYEMYEQKIRVVILQTNNREECQILENDLIEKHKYTLCNKRAAALLPTITPLPSAAKVLHILGDNIRLARLRRRLTQTQICERAGISRPTLLSIESGSSSVSMSAYLNILFVMNLHCDLIKVANDDPVGRRIQDANLISSKSRAV